MPTVPLSPTVALQGGGLQQYGTPSPVEPVRDFAGKQAEQLGQAMQNAGSVLGAIASKIQDQTDDAATKNADITFLTKAQEILRGPNGYFNTVGAGAGNVDGVNAALAEAQKEAEKGLTNDVQRLQFRQASARNMLNFQGQISEHRYKQTTEYAAGESKSRAERYVMEASNNYKSIGMVDAKGKPTGPYATAVNTAVHEANVAADLLMLPPDSEQRKAMVREVYGNVASGVVTNLLTDGKFLEAKSYVDQVVKAGQLDPGTAMKLTTAVDAGYDKQRGIDIAKSVYNGQAVGGTVPPDEVGKAVTQAVPGAQVKVTGKQTSLQSGGSAFQLIAGYEGLRLEPYWDVNHHRVGYGSDTITRADGTVVKTTPGMRISKDDADRDLNRRVAETQQKMASDIGPAWESIPDGAKAALTSVAYNYGGLPQRVVAAAQSGDPQAISKAILGLSGDNGGINSKRRQEEAAVAAGGAIQTRDYHVPNSGGGGFQSINVTPIKGMQINDVVTLMRAKGFEVTDINDMSQQEGAEPIWHMAVKVPDQMIGTREGSVQVPTLPDGSKDLAGMEKAIKSMGLDPDQEETALQAVRQQYTHDEALKTEEYKQTFDAASALAFSRVGGWRDIDPVTWGKLKAEDRAKLIEQPRGSDPDTVIKFLDDPSLGKKGVIEQYRHLLSESDYQKFYAAANGADADKKIPEATIESDLFNNTLLKNGQTSLVNPKDDESKRQLIELRSKFKVLIDAEQTRLKRGLSMTEKQAVLDGMMIDKAFVDSWGPDVTKPMALMSADDMANAYVIVGEDQVRLATIPAGERSKIMMALKTRGMPVTEQAIAELWVKAGKPR